MKASWDTDILEKVMHRSLDMICTIDLDGHFVYVSNACQSILGYDCAELQGRAYLDFVLAEDLEVTRQVGRDIIKGLKTKIFLNHYIHKSGRVVPMQWSAVWSAEEALMFCVARDATEQMLAKHQLAQKDELYRTLTDYGTDMMGLVDAEGVYLRVQGSATAYNRLGYSPSQLIGMNAFSMIHPDDLHILSAAQAAVLVTEEPVMTPAFRFRTGDGNWRWLETTLINRLHNPAFMAIVVSSRDVTEQVTAKLQVQESEQRFKSLFMNTPDMVVAESATGNITDANPAFLAYFKKAKRQLLNQPLTDLLPTDLVASDLSSREVALAGNQVRFMAEVDFPTVGTRMLDINRLPVEVDGKVVGIYTIAKDVTDVIASHKTIKHQANRLNTIFESITDGFCTIDNDWTVTYVNSEFGRLLRTPSQEVVGRNLWELFPEEVNGKLWQQYHEAIETKNSVHFDAYLARLGVWLAVRAFPSEDGLSVYFEDISDTVRAREDVKKLALVASKSPNGVVIIDAAGGTEWVNEGFSKLTGYSLAEVADRKIADVLQGPEADLATLGRVRDKVLQGIPCTEEVMLRRKSGEEIFCSVEITPVLSETDTIVRVIVVLTDITFRKEAEASQSRMTEDLYRRNTDLQQFTYIVSHNLRSPVANAMGLSGLLTRLDKTADLYDTTLTKLQASIGNINTILKDLNAVLTIRDNAKNITTETINLAAKCQQAVASFQESLEACGGTVVQQINPRVQVHGNAAYIYSIFHNLLSNAIKYRSSERPLRIEINCIASKEDSTLISFGDNGVGFDTSKAGNDVFKMYKRFHRQPEGRGIGLFLVKTHIETMGGHIKVASQVNVGTKFTIHFK